MKRLFMLAVIAIVLCTFISCNRNEEQKETTATVEWNITADAAGSGNITIGFPTGEININGDAKVEIGSTNTPVKNVAMVDCNEVIENPKKYSSQAVDVANGIANQTFFHVDTMYGKWNVNITGYAKVDKIYIMIDEHWPNQEDSLLVK